MSHVLMTATGRLTVPKEIRQRLGLEGAVDFDVDVDEVADAIVLRPSVLLRRGDAWAYTPEHRAQLARAHADVAAGRLHELSDEDLAAREAE